MPTVGIMHSGSQGNPDVTASISMFVRTLEQEGYVNGQNNFVISGPCYGGDNPQTMAACAAQLVAQPVNVLVAAGGSRSAQLAAQATQAIPIVFTSVAFPVRPQQNVTGICAQTAELDRRRLELLVELFGQTQFGFLYNSDRFPLGATNTQLVDINNASAILGLQQPNAQNVGSNNGTGGNLNAIGPAFQAWAGMNLRGALVAADSFFNNHRQTVLAAAAANHMPTVYQWREFVNAGASGNANIPDGLMSFGTRLQDAYRQAALYTARILRGTAPQNLPIMQLNTFDLAVNLVTARSLGITIPESILSRADHVVP
jgi:putative tryptophan/tyrosine transport system substrate-binding protein